MKRYGLSDREMKRSTVKNAEARGEFIWPALMEVGPGLDGIHVTRRRCADRRLR